jgi:hypothetical protein
MAWTDDVFDRAHAHNTDLDNIEANFALLKNLFMAGSAPASMAAGHPWIDSTKHVFKYRNDGDSAWVGVMHGDTSQKIWVYRNAAMDGWAVDSAVSDKVLALKGGATYTTGAATAGSWTISGMAHTHTGPSHTHDIPIGPGPTTLAWKSTQTCGSSDLATDYAVSDHVAVNGGSWYQHFVTDAGGTGNTSSGGASDGNWRAAAAVGTLQYLDM